MATTRADRWLLATDSSGIMWMACHFWDCVVRAFCEAKIRTDHMSCRSLRSADRIRYRH
ncbi:MAG: hypothetical protein IPM83_15565 [Ignavibacteria bacterium]|nr:hypothetical protein [Ignavibacteria bacterium]